MFTKSKVGCAGSVVCASCRNAHNWAFKGIDKKVLSARLSSSEAFFAGFLLAVYCWEVKTSNPSEAAVVDFEQMPTSIMDNVLNVVCTSEESVSNSGSMMLGVFWPTAVYKRVEGSDPP